MHDFTTQTRNRISNSKEHRGWRKQTFLFPPEGSRISFYFEISSPRCGHEREVEFRVELGLRRWLCAGIASVGSAVACGSANDGAVNAKDAMADGQASPDGAIDNDGGMGVDGGAGKDSGLTLGEAGTPLSCTTPAAYVNNYVGCGSERWIVKTGGDSQAAMISLTPRETTIAALSAMNGGRTYMSPPTTARVSPDETTLVFIRDVTIVLARAESDSDYHLGIQDATFRKMIAEIPYPGGSGKCLSTGNPWACLISHARAAADTALMPTSSGRNPGVIATIVGIPFYDYSHGQTDVSPYGIELHQVLAICFGQGCTP